jgi:hypothetical protein
MLKLVGLGSARNHALKHVGQPSLKLDLPTIAAVSKTTVFEGLP